MTNPQFLNYAKRLLFSMLLMSFSAVFTSGFAATFSLDKAPDIGQLTHFNVKELCDVARNTKAYIESHQEDKFAVHAGEKIYKGFTLARVKQTLAFICKVYRADVHSKSASRLQDAKFVAEHFDFVRWYPDKQKARNIAKASSNKRKKAMLNNIPDEKIFLTKYYTKLLNGSPVKTVKFDQALYALPYDEDGLSLQQAELKKASLTRFKYTRQQIISGEIDKKALAKPLIWISEEALHDVLLQGTGVIKAGGKLRYFNVHRNNDIAYDYRLGKREQSRYWYFAEVPNIMGYGKNIADKIEIKAQVSFAGNIAELGLGKLIMVNYQLGESGISRMGVLADQGGAFDNNLFQLDLLVDSYWGWSDYHSENKHLPDYTNAWILLVKSDESSNL